MTPPKFDGPQTISNPDDFHFDGARAEAEHDDEAEAPRFDVLLAPYGLNHGLNNPFVYPVRSPSASRVTSRLREVEARARARASPRCAPGRTSFRSRSGSLTHFH